MKFVLTRTSDKDFKKIIEINTLEELKDLQENKYELIISVVSDEDDKKLFPESDGRFIEIYDDWREDFNY